MELTFTAQYAICTAASMAARAQSGPGPVRDSRPIARGRWGSHRAWLLQRCNYAQQRGTCPSRRFSPCLRPIGSAVWLRRGPGATPTSCYTDASASAPRWRWTSAAELHGDRLRTPSCRARRWPTQRSPCARPTAGHHLRDGPQPHRPPNAAHSHRRADPHLNSHAERARPVRHARPSTHCEAYAFALSGKPRHLRDGQRQRAHFHDADGATGKLVPIGLRLQSSQNHGPNGARLLGKFPQHGSPAEIPLLWSWWTNRSDCSSSQTDVFASRSAGGDETSSILFLKAAIRLGGGHRNHTHLLHHSKEHIPCSPKFQQLFHWRPDTPLSP